MQDAESISITTLGGSVDEGKAVLPGVQPSDALDTEQRTHRRTLRETKLHIAYIERTNHHNSPVNE
jgi:hypothetical protein